MAKITNNGQGIRIVNAVVNGRVRQVPVGPGETAELDLLESKGLTAAAEDGRVKVTGAYTAAPEKATGGNKAPKGDNGPGGSSSPASGYAIKEQSPGWHAIVDSDGEVLTKNFRADDLKDFADLDADKQKAFVEANKAD